MTSTLFATILASVVAGIVGVAFILFHPAGAALVLTAISPFDGLFLVFGNAGNIVTFIPIVALLIRTPVTRWIDLFAGTPIQGIFLFVLGALSISHMIAIQWIGFVAVLQFLQKATVLLVMSVFAWSMRNPKHLELMNRVLVVSFSVFVSASLLDFYLGFHLLPGAQDTFGGALGLSAEESIIHELRFAAGGLTINATGNWLMTPIFVGLGWFTNPTRKSGSTAFVCLAICVVGLIATMSRSSILGFAVGLVLVLPSISRLRPAQAIFTAVSAVVIIGVGLLVLKEVGFLDAFLSRFVPGMSTNPDAGEELTRSAVFGAAIRVWLSAPVFGVGDGLTGFSPHGIGYAAHNSFLGVLAEAGVVGLIPYTFMVGWITYRLGKRLPANAHPVYRHWRPFFLAAYVASMTSSMFNEYSWERMTWYAVAFGVAIEAGAAKQRATENEPQGPSRRDVTAEWHLHPALRHAPDAASGDGSAASRTNPRADDR